MDAYLESARRQEPGEIRREITALAKAAFKALEGERSEGALVADLLDQLSPEARKAIQARAVTSRVPTRDDLTSVDGFRREEALELIHGLCVTGGEYVQGRLRPTGRRSRRVLKPHYSGAPVSRGRPKGDAELDLCMLLAIDYEEATGRSPVRYRREKNRGPFVDFVREVLKSVGAAPVSAEKLVRRHDERRWADLEKLWDRWHRRLRRLDQMRSRAW
jgi:hypothetical protein